MERLVVQDVRCFSGLTRLQVAPLTFLVGENSTGKSTLLALLRVAWDLAFGRAEPDFNEEPFQLGAYDEIARFHGGQGKRVRSFSLGLEFSRKGSGKSIPDASESMSVIGTFTSRSGQPYLSGVRFESGRWSIAASETSEKTSLEVTTPTGQYRGVIPAEYFGGPPRVQELYYLLDQLRHLEAGEQLDLVEAEVLPSRKELISFTKLLDPIRRGRLTSRPLVSTARPFAIAPIRTKPRRTYDPLREAQSPEGDHVPMLLARLRARGGEEWKLVSEELERYGKGAGLFDSVQVKRFGQKDGVPFQLRVQLHGQRADANLVDVGYGVSQILPILVDCITARRGSRFLMQQPEVHLHPRAQAELGTFLVSLVRSRNQQFVVETHSDFLVDRVRMEVRDGRLRSEDVALIFLERKGPVVTAHEMSLDANGETQGQPESYREFFLNEEMRQIFPGQKSERR